MKSDLRILVRLFFYLMLNQPLMSCGPNQVNIFSYTATTKDINAYDVNYELAKSKYDHGEFTAALSFAQDAYALDNESLDVRLLLGFIYLARSGIEPITIAKNLSSNSGSSSDSSSDSLLGAGLFSQEDVAALGELDESDPDYPVILPNCSEDVREAQDFILNINLAIKYACPVVNPNILNPFDYRDTCTSIESVDDGHRTKAHFLWALTHILEASIFQAALNYSTAEDGVANLTHRIDDLEALDSSNPANFTTIVAKVTSINTALDSLLPSSSTCIQTQLTATLYDLQAASEAFKGLPGLSSSMQKPVDAMMEKITSFQNQAKTVDSGSTTEQTQMDSGVKALRSKFSDQAATQVSAVLEQISAQGDTSSISATEKQDLCDAFNSMNDSGMAKPEACQ